MTYLSVLSARRFNTTASIVVLVDDETAKVIEGTPLSEVVECVVVSVPQGSIVFRSRYLKTTIRSHLRGDFIFLDVDTLVVGSLSGIWDGVEDISVALDLDRNQATSRIPREVIALYEKLEWPTVLKGYYNSGVMAVRDTVKVGALFEIWHRKWIETFESGCVFDQPSMNYAIETSEVIAARMDSRFHSMVFVEPRVRRDSRVLHFFTVRGNPDPDSILAYLLKSMDSGKIDWKQLDRSVKQGHPWGPPYRPWLLRRSGNLFLAFVWKMKALLSR